MEESFNQHSLEFISIMTLNLKLKKIVFPGADEATLVKLVSASSVASFGKGNTQIIDQFWVIVIPTR